MKFRRRFITSLLACSLIVSNSFAGGTLDVRAEKNTAEEAAETVYQPSFESEEGQDWFFSNSYEDISFNGEMNITQLDQYAIDKNAPDLQDGCLMATFKASELYNLTPVVRYQDADNLVTMGFGGNNVIWCSRNQGEERYGTEEFAYDYSGKDYVTVKIVFKEAKISLFLDGYKACEGENATYLGAGKCGFRTWNGKKDITVKDLYYTNNTENLYAGMSELYALLDSCDAYEEALYTAESYEILELAMDHAGKTLADAELQKTKIQSVQAALDQAYEDLEEGIAGLKEKSEERINIAENYEKDPANWSGAPASEQGMLRFEIPAGETVQNLNGKAQTEAGAFTYGLRTDSEGRFGVAFNCSGDSRFNAVYYDGAGTYSLRTQDGEVLELASDSLELLPETEYSICIVSNPYGVSVYVNSILAGKADVEGLCENKGGIGLYNPTDQPMNLGLRSCQVYETFYYFNDYSDPEKIGTWETENTAVTHVTEGSLNGDGELKLETKPVSYAFAKDTPRIRNGVYEFDLSNNVQENAGRIVFLFRGADSKSFAGMFYDVNGNWKTYLKQPGEAEHDIGFNGSALFTESAKHHFRMEVQDQSVALFMDGQLVGRGEYDLPEKAGYFGIRKNFQSADIRLDNLKVTETYTLPEPDREEKPVSIQSESMQVRMDEAFPRVMDYSLNQKTLPGNNHKVYGVKLNSNLYYPMVSCEKKDDAALVYTLEFPDIDVVMKVQYRVTGRQLHMNILSIRENGTEKVETISFVDDVLFSTDAKDHKASMGTVYADNTWTSVKEKLYPTLEAASVGESFQTYVTLASGGLAATVNNSALETGHRMRVEFADENGAIVGKAGNDLLDYHRPDTEDLELPWATVLISEDYNKDGDVNWQDAAASYKKIRDKVVGDDQMKNNMMWIAYNSGSQVQEPFYKSLDMVRQFYNFTDGFGQMVMHKGYQAEGHDDSHGDYGSHIGTRQGGKEAFQKIIEMGKDYNAKFGIHINVNEHMLDSLHLNQDSLNMPLSANWGHWDQAYTLNQSKDILSGNRDKNLDELKRDLPDLNFVYVDIYGLDAPAGWMSNNLEKALNSRGYIVGTEFSGPMEQGAAFTHWGNDIHYPNDGNTSVMMRYFKNDTDVFVATALTLGNRIPGVATWGDTNIREGVETFYNHILLTKYLQHLDLLDYEPGQYAVFSEGVRTEFTPEGDKIILTCEGRKMAEWDYLGLDGYGSELTGEAKLLLPWFEGEEGQPNQADKLYHWNADGGISTWEVPESWKDYSSADVYRLTGDEKKYAGTASIENHKITLEAEQGIGYVLYPAGHTAPAAAAEFGKGSPLMNPGFDTSDLSMWNVETEQGADARVSIDQEYETMLTMKGEAGSAVSVSQEMKGLRGGKTYTAYLFADVDKSSSLQLSVKAGDKNVTTKAAASLIPYYGISKYNGTNFQKVKVTFDLPENADSAVLTLKGMFDSKGSITLDDIRIWENETRSPRLGDAGMESYIVYEDFENVEQGYGAFVGAGGPGTGWDHRIHLAETRETSSQYLDYVADGHYSLKITQDGAGNLIRTNANTVKLAPNTEYELGLEYITGVNGRYQMSVRNSAGDVVLVYDFEKTQLIENSHSLSSRRVTKTFRTGNTEDYYVSIDTIDNDAEAVPEAPEMGNKLERTFLSLDNFYIKDGVERITTIFVADGEETRVVTKKGEMPEIKAPVKEGYQFIGWYTEPDGGTQITEFNQDQTVYAQFQKAPIPSDELTKEDIQRALLDITYNAYVNLDTTSYTEESAKALAAAIKAAEELKKQEHTAGDEFQKAAEDILKAAAGLKVYTSDLEAAAKAAKEAADAAKKVAEEALKAAADNNAAAKAAQEAAKIAEEAAKLAQEKADLARKEAEEAKAEIEEAMKAAEAQAAELEKKIAQAEEARKAAEAAQKSARDALQKAEEAQKSAKEAQQKAEAALKAAQNASDKAEFKAGRVVLKSIKSAKKKQIKVSWKRVINAEGYMIQYATNPSFKKGRNVNVKGGNTVSRSFKKLKSKTKYYIRVKAYKKIENKKIYTKYSSGRPVKVK